jgi:hypothetical protein
MEHLEALQAQMDELNEMVERAKQNNTQVRDQ